MRRPAISALLIGAVLAGATARAEGSFNFAPSGTTNNRAFLEVGPPGYVTSGIQRKTTLYAYANAGENILLGSSVMRIGSGDIRITAPDNTAQTCLGNNLGTGLISRRVNEVAGPLVAGLTVVNGYTPCIYRAATTGIYQLDFLAPVLGGGNPPVTAANGDWPAPAATDPWIAAWDATVVSGTSRKPGRVFTKYFAMNVGGNNPANTGINVYPLTRDGYRYSFSLNFDPFGFIFYVNNVGTLTAATAGGTPAYRSAGVGSAQYSPAQADSGDYVTHKLFFNPPDPGLPASAAAPSGLDNWLLRAAPVTPPQPTNLSFTGADGTAGQAGGGIGGTFTFTNPGASSAPYRIVLAFGASTNGANSDRVLVGTAKTGENLVVWDGKDGAGKDVVPSTAAYTVKAYLAAGEVHFPLIDAENLTDLTVRRLNNVDSDANTVYWDDRTVASTGTAPVPLNALGGVESQTSTNTHAYSGNWGNDLIVDTWAYYPGTAADLASGVRVSEADVQVTKTYVSGGSTAVPAQFDVTVKNLSTTTTARNVRIEDAVPPGFSALSWSCPSGCVSQGGTPTTGGPGAVDTYATLTPQASVTLRVTATLSAASTKDTLLSNTARASRGADATDPVSANNTSTVRFTALGVPKLTLGKTVRNVTQNGAAGTSSTGQPNDVLEYVITFQNVGDANVQKLFVRDSLEAPLRPQGTGTLVCPGGTSSTFAVTMQIEVNVGAACGDLAPNARGTVTFQATVR